MIRKPTYATKNDLKRLEARVNLRFANVDDRFDKLENKILESEERILHELQKSRDNNDAHGFSHERINLEIEELQKKVGTV